MAAKGLTAPVFGARPRPTVSPDRPACSAQRRQGSASTRSISSPVSSSTAV